MLNLGLIGWAGPFSSEHFLEVNLYDQEWILVIAFSNRVELLLIVLEAI